MRRQHKISDLVHRNIFPNPGPADPPDFATHLQKNLVSEVRVETTRFYGSLDTVEARYPGLNYSHPPHRRRLSRFPHHARLFQAFDDLGLTETEIGMLCRWEGTLWARERYERDEGVKVVDTTGTEIGKWVDPRRSYARRNGANGASDGNGAASGKEIKVMTDIEVEIEDANQTTAGASSSSIPASMASVIRRSRDTPTSRVHSSRRMLSSAINARSNSQAAYMARDMQGRRFRASPLRTESPRRMGVETGDVGDGNTTAGEALLDRGLTTLLNRFNAVSTMPANPNPPPTSTTPSSSLLSSDVEEGHPTVDPSLVSRNTAGPTSGYSSASDATSTSEPLSFGRPSTLTALFNLPNPQRRSLTSLNSLRLPINATNARSFPIPPANPILPPLDVTWEDIARILPPDVDRAAVAEIWENLIKHLSESMDGQEGSTDTALDPYLDANTIAATAANALHSETGEDAGNRSERGTHLADFSRMSHPEGAMELHQQLQHHQEQIGHMTRAIQEYYRIRRELDGGQGATASS